MKVFLSWSGDVSHQVALVLRDWLPSVIQSVEPYVSSEDIDKGTRWSTDIAKELEESSYGIICVTKSNLDAPWLNFEAGALSKAFEKSRVSPFLFNIKRSEIKSGPLLQFQSTTYSKPDVSKLVAGINKAVGETALPEKRLTSVFDVWWPQLNEQLNELSPVVEIGADDKDTMLQDASSNEILEELLELTRSQQRLLNDPTELLPMDYLEHVFREVGLGSRVHPGAFAHMSRSIRELEMLVTDAQENNKRSVPLKTLGDVVEEIVSPLTYIERRLRSMTRRRRPSFGDDDV